MRRGPGTYEYHFTGRGKSNPLALLQYSSLILLLKYSIWVFLVGEENGGCKPAPHVSSTMDILYNLYNINLTTKMQNNLKYIYL